MGIEPTCEALDAPHNGFEDRDRHQAGTHFLSYKIRVFLVFPGLLLAPFLLVYYLLYYR